MRSNPCSSNLHHPLYENLDSIHLTLYPHMPDLCCSFIREIGYFVCKSMVHALPRDLLVSVAPELAKQLADGLSDNWSQVLAQ